jgi:hypothetical protein
LGSWHSTTELLPPACVFRYLTAFKGLSPSCRQSIRLLSSLLSISWQFQT